MRLISMNELDLLLGDPVRPHIPKLDVGKQVYVLDDKSAVICVCYCTQVPETEQELEQYKSDEGSVLVAYTVWSSKKGAGRKIVNKLLDKVQQKELGNIKRLVTLSPLTMVAERFHTRNGAKLIAKNEECQNFEYEIC